GSVTDRVPGNGFAGLMLAERTNEGFMHQNRRSEARLDALREEAARTGHVQPADIVVIDRALPGPSAAKDYHGLPVLKAPVWTWQVPLYFLAGGIAGASAVIAFFAHMLGHNPELIRLVLWLVLGGAR